MPVESLFEIVQPLDPPVVALQPAQILVERLLGQHGERAREPAGPRRVGVAVAPLLGVRGLLGTRVDQQVQPMGIGRAVDATRGRQRVAHRFGLDETTVRVPEPPGARQVRDALTLVGLPILAAVEHPRGEGPRMRRRREHGVERRAQVRLEVLVRPASRLEHEVLPVGEGDRGHGLVTPETRDLVGEAAQAGEGDVQRDRMRLRGPARGFPQQVRQFRADALERERAPRSAPQQRVDRDPVDPRLVQHLAPADALQQRVGRDERDDRARGRPADGVHAHVYVVLVAQVLERHQQRCGRARLIGAERRPARQRQRHAKGLRHARPDAHVTASLHVADHELSLEQDAPALGRPQ